MKRMRNARLTAVSQELRKNMTPQERHLWYDFLRKHPAKFHRQSVIGRFIVDFYSPSAKLVIEKRRGADGADYASLSMVYMASEDLRNADAQATSIKLVVYPLRLKNLTVNSDGFYSFADVMARIDEVLTK